MIGLRRVISIEGKDYSIYQLPCSDEIEVNHPEGFKYLVCATPGESEKYRILKHTKSYKEAELFLLGELKSAHNKDLIRIDITKHSFRNGKIYNKQGSECTV